MTIAEGNKLNLSCNAVANPAPTLSWTKDGSQISNTSRISFSSDFKSLTINQVSRTDSGVYRCVAVNNLGNINSAIAKVDVQCK